MTPSALETSTAWGLPRREGGTPSTRPLAAKAPDPPSCLHVHFPEEALSKTLERLSRSSGAQELARWLGDLSLPRAPRHSAVASGGQQVTGVPAVSLFSQGLLSDFTTRVNKSSPSQQGTTHPRHPTPRDPHPTTPETYLPTPLAQRSERRARQQPPPGCFFAFKWHQRIFNQDDL